MNTQHEAMDDTAGLIGHDDKFITSEGWRRVDTHRVMSCTGPCDQGRQPCPCPAECQIPQAKRGHVSGAKPLLLYFAACLVAVCAAIGQSLA